MPERIIGGCKHIIVYIVCTQICGDCCLNSGVWLRKMHSNHDFTSVCHICAEYTILIGAHCRTSRIKNLCHRAPVRSTLSTDSVVRLIADLYHTNVYPRRM